MPDLPDLTELDTIARIIAHVAPVAINGAPAARDQANAVLSRVATYTSAKWKEETAAVATSRAAAQAHFDSQRALWASIHKWGLAHTPGVVDEAFLDGVMQKLLAIGGCQPCAMNMATYRAKNPVDWTTPGAVFAWTVAFHNHVNATKPGGARNPVVVTVEAAQSFWSAYKVAA